MPSVVMVGDLEWLQIQSRWMLEIELTISTVSEHVPSSTRWCVLTRDDYPAGPIEIYPAKAGGIVVTFPHQNRNDEGDPKVPWRTGKICVEETVRSLGRLGGGSDPRTVDGRLLWHIRRAILWLTAAASGTLTQTGDPFELPDFGRDDSLTVAFAETAETLALWRTSDADVGTATIRGLKTRRGDIRLVTEFRTERGLIVQAPWRDSQLHKEPSHALWLRLPQIPTLPVWRAPRTWRELRETTAGMDFDLDTTLRRYLGLIRNEDPPLMLVGFPVPETFREEPVQLHWQAIRLPKLGISAKGWRNNESGWWQRERYEVLANDERIPWIATENWAQEQISRRSRLRRLSQRRVLLIGAGAIGSLVAELLVRGGVSEITVMDSDDVQIGNLVRHTLTINDVHDRKAQALAGHLNHLGPTVNATPQPTSFPPEGNQRAESLSEHDLVIDCTADDTVLEALGQIPLTDGTQLVSLSLGLGAKRLYCDFQSPPFDADAFRKRVMPYVEQDHTEFTGELPWDATGCWHPLFPGRLDELWSLVATAVGRMEAWLENGAPEVFLVVERLEDGEIRIR